MPCNHFAQAVAGASSLGNRKRCGNDGRRPAHASPAKHQRGHPSVEQRHQRLHRESKDCSTSLSTIHNRKPAVDDTSRQLVGHRQLESKINHRFDACRQNALDRGVRSIADPQPVGKDFSHEFCRVGVVADVSTHGLQPVGLVGFRNTNNAGNRYRRLSSRLSVFTQRSPFDTSSSSPGDCCCGLLS